jgi:DHA2 family methylenomycin A resistance protein-like MFS transporter
MKQSSKEPSFIWIVGTISLAFVVAQVDVTIVNIALPQIAKTYKADVSTLQWIIDAYTVAFAALMLTAGSLSDLIGSKRIFQLGIFVFAIASMGCGLAWGSLSIIVFRIIQGIGAAMMIPSSLALLNQSFSHDNKKRTHAVAIWTAAGAVALAVGPVCGGLLIKLSNWRFIFFVNAPLCAAGILLSIRLENCKKRAKKGFDIIGQITWTVALAALIAIIIEWKNLGFTSPLIWGGLIISIGMFALFLRTERKIIHPMLPLTLFDSSHFNVLLLMGAIFNNAYYGTVFILSLYLQNVLHYPPLKAGLAFLPLTLGFLVSNLLSGKMISKYGMRPPILIGLFTFIAGFIGLMLAGSNTPYWRLCIPFFIIPAGMGLAVPAMTNGILASVDTEISGTASAVLNTTRQAGGAIGVAVFGAIAVGGAKSVVHALSVCSGLSIAMTIAVTILIFKYLQHDSLIKN